MNHQAERILWSIAIPGFGQFLNQKYLKGIALILLELLINNGSHLNQIILLSFQGRISQAISTTNYQWLMFYPCVYMFGIWDAYKDAGGTAPFAYLPFVLTAFFGTVGIVLATCALERPSSWPRLVSDAVQRHRSSPRNTAEPMPARTSQNLQTISIQIMNWPTII